MPENFLHAFGLIGFVKQAAQQPVTLALVLRMMPAIILIGGLSYGYGELHANMKHMEQSLKFVIETSHDEIHAELKGFKAFDEAAHFTLRDNFNDNTARISDNTDRIDDLVSDFYIPNHGSN